MKTAHDLVALAKEHIQEVTLDTIDEAIQNADLVIDVREADEFQLGHIPGAINIPRGVLEFKISSTPELDRRDLNIVIYCKTSGRSTLAAKSLKEMGFLSVLSIAGGFDAWEAAGKAIAKPQPVDFD